jgi:hypothetical protein
MHFVPDADAALPYLAPELMSGATPDGRATLYGLAAVLYAALTGSAPVGAAPGAAAPTGAAAHALPKDESAPAIPRDLSAVIARGLRAVPDERYPDVEAFGMALYEAAQEVRLAQSARGRGGYVRPPHVSPGGGEMSPLSYSPPAGPSDLDSAPDLRLQRAHGLDLFVRQLRRVAMLHRGT